MRSTVEHSADGIVAATQYMARLWPERCEYSTSPGVMSLFTGAPVAGMNAVTVLDGSVDAQIVDEYLSSLEDHRLPFSFWSRPGGGGVYDELVERHHLTRSGPVPLMTHDVNDHLRHSSPPGLTVRVLAPEEIGLHLNLAAAVFGTEVGNLAHYFTPTLMAKNSVYALVGEVGGEVVTTGLSVFLGQWVAIFSVVTPEQHRRRGYGASITAACAELGYARGATTAILQSSTFGLSVYERMGFRVQELWAMAHGPASAG